MSKSSLKLYKVELKGMHKPYQLVGTSFVVATDPTNAYDQVKGFLKERDFGFNRERELNCITLIAENNEDTLCGTLLFLPDRPLTDEENLDLPDSPEAWVKDFISESPPVMNCVTGVVENDETRLMKALLAGAKFEHRRKHEIEKEITTENERLREDIRALKNAAKFRNNTVEDIERRVEELKKTAINLEGN
jgi:hypothetical protein